MISSPEERAELNANSLCGDKAIKTVSTGKWDADTRPVNVYVHWIIKVKQATAPSTRSRI